MGECLLDVRRSDIQVIYTSARSLVGDNDSVFSFGWNDPLKMDGLVVQDFENFPRYENDFAQVAWGSKYFNISSENHSLILDFENLKLSLT